MDRFLDKINKTENCWEWTAAIRGNTGYGSMRFRGKVWDAHRISYSQIWFAAHFISNKIKQR